MLCTSGQCGMPRCPEVHRGFLLHLSVPVAWRYEDNIEEGSP